MRTLPVVVGSPVTAPAPGAVPLEVLAASGGGPASPLVMVLSHGPSRFLLGHLESGPSGSLWVAAPLDEEAVASVLALDLTGWEDVGWDDAYDLLDPDVPVTLLDVSPAGVVQSSADVAPRPADLEALLDAAVDVFGGGGCCGGGCDLQ